LYARFDGESWKRSSLATDTEKNTQRGNQRAKTGPVPYHQELPPRQLPTLHRGLGATVSWQRKVLFTWEDKGVEILYPIMIKEHCSGTSYWLVAGFVG
jgi:hypothetical protein